MQDSIAQFSAMTGLTKVDREKGIIFGVSVISEGEAVTHDVWIDATTISQIVQLGKASEGGIRVKVKHEGKDQASPVVSIIGSLKNFRQDGPQARADFHLLTSDANYEKIMEMAEKQPKDFGLSISSKQFEVESISDKDFFRIKSLESVDLTSDPAANASGLFSKHMNDHDKDDKVEYAADGKTHSEKCMCKGCMSKMGQYKKMSQTVIAALGLSENATDDEIKLALEKKSAMPTDKTAALETKITELGTALSKLQADGANQLALAKKGEIETLLAEAAKDGKVVPFDTDDLFSVKDGVCTVKMEPTQLAKMISKIQPTVQLSRKSAPVPKTSDGKELPDRDLDPIGWRKATKQFARQAREQGAVQLGQFMKGQTPAFGN